MSGLVLTAMAILVLVWIGTDGPIRLIAGFVAVLHHDPTRRADARQVREGQAKTLTALRSQTHPSTRAAVAAANQETAHDHSAAIAPATRTGAGGWPAMAPS